MASVERGEQGGMNSSGRGVSDGGGACGCAKEAAAAIGLASTQALGHEADGASNSSGTNARTVEQWSGVVVVGGGSGDGGVCGQQSTSANQRVTNAGADQLATAEGSNQRRELSVGHHCTSGECCKRNCTDEVLVGRLASTVCLDGASKIRSKHFSASVNQFNYEPSGEEGASQRDPLSEQPEWRRRRRRQDDHEQELRHQQQQRQPNCSLIPRQPGEQDATTTTVVITGERRRETGLFVSETANERDRARESAQVQAAAAPGQLHSSASRQPCQAKKTQQHHNHHHHHRQEQQQQQQIKHDRADSLESGKQTLGSALDGPERAHLEDINQRRESLVSANNPSFWTKLSNLSRSIIQQQRQLQQHQQQSFSDSSASATTYAPDDEAANIHNDISSFLAPEVVSYLETKKKQSNLAPSALASSGPGDGGLQTNWTEQANMTKTSSCRNAAGDEQREPLDGGLATAASGLDDKSGARGRLQGAGKQEELSGTRRRKRETVTQVTSQHHLVEQRQEVCPPTLHHRSQTNVAGQKVIKLVELQQATISSNKMQQQQQKTLKANTNELELAERLDTHTGDGGGGGSSNKPAETPGRHQVKLSITTTTNTSTTSTATRSSSASSLSSCILSESMSAESDEVRLKWGKKMDFLLSIIGFAVDLANIWRFPYLVYKNGGGVFLIPYLTMLIFGGIPLFFLELCLGQFVKKGPITVWNKICPYMKGVGYCSILISWYVSFYYNVLIAWSVYFIYRSILSFGHKMPWEDCDNSWNTVSTCVSISQLKELCSHRTNVTLESCRKEMFSSINVTSPASEFFVKELSQIDQSSGLDDMGYLRPELVICTMIVYLLHYFSLFRGLETSGKVVWVTATAPYMILSILLVRGLFLPGASMGIEYYLSPKLEKLADPQVWIDAAGQVFYSIGVGFGVHLTYASFNSHDNNCYRDCLMTSAVNALTSVYSGLVVFVYLGYMATNLGIEIEKVASEGYSLVFEVYPEALTTLPFARFWSILFFIMLLTLGIDSAMGGLEAVITGLEDEFRFAKRLSRGQLTGLVIVSSFLPALISCTQGGAYTLFWFDIYSAGVSLLFSALFETIGVVYCYGLDKFILNIESMLGKRPQFFYIICWKYISPTFLIGIIFMSIYTASVPTYRGYTFPIWSVVLGWCLTFSSVAAVPIVAIWTLYSRSGNKAISVSPSKSPRKPNAGGAISATSGGSRNVSRKSTPSLGHQCRKSMSAINYSDVAQPGGARATSSVINLPPDHQPHPPHQHHHHCYKEGTRIEEEML